jgi:catechol 2,3-dioxygenase-like lactoylglutathione lyase family enzyme
MAVPDPVKVQAIHHFAYKSRDAEETRRFYEDVMGLPLAMVVEEYGVTTTTGEQISFIHYFFEMADGNYLAFFDFADGIAPQPDPATPRFANHLALRIENEEQLLAAKARLEAHGIEVQGPLDHEFVRSIYFWDPNGIRLEYAYTLFDPGRLRAERDKAAEILAHWSARTKAV